MNFTEEELEEIYGFIEATEGASIDGIEIDGFMQIYSVAKGKEDILNVSEDRITSLIQQVELERDFFESIGCGDLTIFKKIILMLKSKPNLH